MGLFLWLAVVMLITVLLGQFRIIRGPEPADRMLAAQLLGTGGVALLLILGIALNNPFLLDVALVSALLAAFAGLAFVRMGGGHGDP